MNLLLMISAFIAPVLFLGTKRYGLFITSLIAIIFSITMFKVYNAEVSFDAKEISIFLYLTQALNACALLLVFTKLMRNKKMNRVKQQQSQVIVENPIVNEEIEINNFSDLLRAKGILNDNKDNKRKRA